MDFYTDAVLAMPKIAPLYQPILSRQVGKACPGPCQLKNYDCDWQSLGRKHFFCHCPRLFKHSPLRGKAGPHCPGLSKISKDLTLLSCMGLTKEHAGVGLVSIPKVFPLPFN